jgi:GT2 family glycosyltransferase
MMATPAPAGPLNASVLDEDILAHLHWGDPSCGAADVGYGSERTPGCTVVVCTYCRAASLSRFLESLKRQDVTPKALVVVDASPDDKTQVLLSESPSLISVAPCVLYFRVRGRHKGLTRQRNFAIKRVRTDLVAFFDDDIVLAPECLSEMQRVHCIGGPAVAGTGAIMHNAAPEQSRRGIWRLRRWLGVVSTLEPGQYCRSGVSTPWGSLPASTAPLEGDWLPGGATMWKTDTVVKVAFNDAFTGYALSEDLDFSLRARRTGKLIMVPAARVWHLHATEGRPDEYELGYSSIFNRYQVHRRCLADRTWRDVLAFAYAWSVDSLLLLRHLTVRRRARATLDHLRGRLRAGRDLIGGRSRSEPISASASSASETRVSTGPGGQRPGENRKSC